MNSLRQSSQSANHVLFVSCSIFTLPEVKMARDFYTEGEVILPDYIYSLKVSDCSGVQVTFFSPDTIFVHCDYVCLLLQIFFMRKNVFFFFIRTCFMFL